VVRAEREPVVDFVAVQLDDELVERTPLRLVEDEQRVVTVKVDERVEVLPLTAACNTSRSATPNASPRPAPSTASDRAATRSITRSRSLR
jgi:hypothetical protein